MIVFLLLFSFALASSLVLTPTERNVSPVKPIIKPSEFLSSSSKHANVGEVTVTEKVSWTPYIQLGDSFVLLNFPDLRGPTKKLMKNVLKRSKELAGNSEVAAKDAAGEKISAAQEESKTVNLKPEENLPKTDPKQVEINSKQQGEGNLAEKSTQSIIPNIEPKVNRILFHTKVVMKLSEVTAQGKKGFARTYNAVEKRVLNQGSKRLQRLFLNVKDTREALKRFMKVTIKDKQYLTKCISNVETQEDQFLESLDELRRQMMKARVANNEHKAIRLDNSAVDKIKIERIRLMGRKIKITNLQKMELTKQRNIMNEQRRQMAKKLVERKSEKGEIDADLMQNWMDRERRESAKLAKMRVARIKFHRNHKKSKLRFMDKQIIQTKSDIKRMQELLDTKLQSEMASNVETTSGTETTSHVETTGQTETEIKPQEKPQEKITTQEKTKQNIQTEAQLVKSEDNL